MGLVGNGFRHNLLGKLFGGTNLNGANPSVHLWWGHRPNADRNILMGEAELSSSASLPDGCRHPMVWVMPNKPGGLSSRNSITGSGGASATAQSGYNIDATITGDGGITNAPLGLIVSIAATLIASGGITSAATQALASMIAALTGSGNITATAKGLADLGAALSGTGTVTANNTALMDISADIRGYGDLTPEGIRDAVWNAMLINYPTSGSAGNTLALAGSGGVDYTALANAVWTRAERTLSSQGNEDIANAVMQYAIEAGWSVETMMRVFAAVLAGKVSGAGTGTEIFRGINDDKARVTATVDAAGNRTNIVTDAT